MKHKYTKILGFSFFLFLLSCGSDENSGTEDYSNESETDVENIKALEYRPDGDYDTTTEIEDIAKDRRHHRKDYDAEDLVDTEDASSNINVHENPTQAKTRIDGIGTENEAGEEDNTDNNENRQSGEKNTDVQSQ